MKKVLFILILMIMILGMTGCTTSADTVAYNISREADEFKVKRRVTFINLRTNEFLFTIKGNCSIKGYDELEVICRIGEDKYQKHFFKVSNETTYVIEQLEYNDVSRYDYELIFRPEAIIPIEIKTQVGQN